MIGTLPRQGLAIKALAVRQEKHRRGEGGIRCWMLPTLSYPSLYRSEKYFFLLAEFDVIVNMSALTGLTHNLQVCNH